MPTNTKIRFKHFHEGNDPWVPVIDEIDGAAKLGKDKLPIYERVRGSAIYATQAALVDLDNGNIIEESWAYCSPNDAPSRKKGREVALGRLERKLHAGKWRQRHKALAEAIEAANAVKLISARASALAELGV